MSPNFNSSFLENYLPLIFQILLPSYALSHLFPEIWFKCVLDILTVSSMYFAFCTLFYILYFVF